MADTNITQALAALNAAFDEFSEMLAAHREQEDAARLKILQHLMRVTILAQQGGAND